MDIGLISDTHNQLPENINHLFKDVDIILHAGDIGYSHILENLSKIAAVEGVYGNTDLYTVSSILPSRLDLKLEGLNIFIRHDIGDINFYYAKLKSIKKELMPDIIIFGHTHRPFFKKIQRTYFINPGSASKSREGIPCSVMRLSISKGKVTDHQLIAI
jgi:putative phosphoesterase